MSQMVQDTFVVLEVCSGDKVLTIETDSQSNYDMVTTSSTMSSGSVSIFFILLSVWLTVVITVCVIIVSNKA